MSAELIMNWMLHTGLDISILIALILVFRRPFGRMFGAGAAYSLWLLPLIRLFLPEIPIILPRPSWMSAPPQITTEMFEFSGSLPMSVTPAADPINWQLPVLALWLGVAFIWMISQMFSQRKYLGGVLHGSKTVSKSIQGKLEEATDNLKLKRRPRVRIASMNVGPLVTGTLDPMIILPHNFETEFSGRQQYFALTHELAHIKRHDLFAAFGTLVFRALNWPNPLVHLGAARFRADQEAACDAYVLRIVGGGQTTKQSYAETLIHSARLSQYSPKSIGSASSNPLCLTIHHPLKERLMTMKTTKSPSTILSRVGVAAFLVAGLAITAPITIASAQQAPAAETKMKKVIKMVENENGVETTKTYEIIEEDGKTTVYSIDGHGNKTVVTESEIGEIPMMGGEFDIELMEGPEPGQKRIKIIGSGDDIHLKGEGHHDKVMIKRINKGEDGQAMEMDSEVFVFKNETGGGSQAHAMVSAAKQLLDQVDSMQGENELSSNAKRKLEKARKALAEAEAALDAE